MENERGKGSFVFETKSKEKKFYFRKIFCVSIIGNGLHMVVKGFFIMMESTRARSDESSIRLWDKNKRKNFHI